MTEEKDRNTELEQDLEVTEEEAENVKGGMLPLRELASSRRKRKIHHSK